MKTLSIDIETYSSVDLAKCGVYKYTEATDFDILLFGYSADGNPVQVVDLASGETIPPEVIAALTNDDVTKWAFNAQFERICLSRWLRDHGVFDNAYYSIPEDTVGNYLDPASWKCTMIWSAYMGLPLSLEGVGAVLGLGKQKLTEGKELIKYFCQPCAPTKANGGRTRNLPENAPDKWAAFKRYNIRDVEVEMSIQEKLAKFPVPEMVWEQYHLDQEINDRGVALDMELVHQAIAMDTRSRADLTAAMKKLTALDNPNSVQQMKQWLSDNGLEVDSLGKKEVAEMLKTAPAELQKVLLLRQQLAKSSVKKYQAMEKAVCADGRARGMFQFYGANRTGRWAGRIIQMQNLPQNHLPDLAEARGLVRCGDFEGVELGVVEPLFDQDHRVRAGLLGLLDQLHYKGHIPVGAFLHFGVEPSEVFGRVLCFHAECLPELVLTEGVGVGTFGCEIAAFVVVAFTEPCRRWAVEPPVRGRCREKCVVSHCRAPPHPLPEPCSLPGQPRRASWHRTSGEGHGSER